MKLSSKTISLISIFIFSAVAFTGCGYWYKHKSPEEKADWIVEEVQETLELTDTQMRELNVLKNELLTVRKELKDSHNKSHDNILTLLEQATLDQNKLQSIIDKKLNYFSEKSSVLVQSFAAFYDSLTPEQQAKLREEWVAKSNYHHHHGH